MEQKILPVVYSKASIACLQTIFDYGAETFSLASAEVFITKMAAKIESLSDNYLQYSECRYLPTKDRRYRWFSFSSYVTIYRITEQRIEVLLILHKSQSITRIRSARSVKV
jgi:plasmid stabilization system protein ParE